MSVKHEIRFVLLAQTGDLDALDEIFKLLQTPVYRYIYGLTNNQDLSEDILQEVFISIYRKIKFLRQPELFRAWAYRIATRETFKQLKREREWFEQIRDEEVLETIPEPEKPEDFEPELIKKLPELLEKLSSASRIVISLHYLQELTLQETAEVLGISVGTVKSRLNYGLTSLRESVKKEN